MTPLKEFANLIDLHKADLAATFATVLTEREKDDLRFASEQQQVQQARHLLSSVVSCCKLNSPEPLTRYLNQQVAESPVSVTTLLDLLAEILTPIIPNLQAGKFFWKTLLYARTHVEREIVVTGVGKLATEPAAPKLATENGTPSPPKERTSTAKFRIEKAQRVANLIPSLDRFDRAVKGDPTVGDLAKYPFRVETTNIVREVAKTLSDYPELPGVIITENGIATNIISRRRFFEQLGQMYGIAIYSKRPIELMLRGLETDPLRLSGDTSIPDALMKVLDRSLQFVYEPVIVEKEPGEYFMIDVYTLLIAQSKLYANLQIELQQANDDLEARVEQRTAELQQINIELTAEIVKRKQIEQELIEARDEALAASRFKTQLLAKVSHELRTPLGGILGHTEMVHAGVHGPLSEGQRQAAERIIQSTQYLTSLVNQLLDQAQLDAGKLKLAVSSFDPKRMVQDAMGKLEIVAQKKNLDLKATFGPDLPTEVCGDPIRTEQVLVNLVSNAVKFTQEGHILIDVARRDEQYWTISVSDTGKGIPEEAQRLVFEPFGQVDGSMTREHPGTGLGLSIVQQFVTMMDGDITLHSTPGEGSTFTVILPIQEHTT